jgi:hypothetical protein
MIRTTLPITLALCSSFALAACEKADAKASGPLGADDLALLKDLPGGNVAIMGGNYMKMQNFMQSSLGQLTQRAMDKAGGGVGFNEWMKCFADQKQLKIAGGVALTAGVEMRLAFKGMTLQQIEACAKRASFGHTMDADGKYVSIEVPVMGVTATQGYLQLADGTIYNRQRIALGGLPSVDAASRAELEADVVALTKASAADDKKLVELAAKADRTQTIWFAGSAKGTPAAAKVGDVYGSLDIDGGIKANVVVGFTDSSLPSQIEDGLEQARKMSDRLPPEVKSMLDDVKLKRDGNQVRFSAKLTDNEIQSLTKLGGL